VKLLLDTHIWLWSLLQSERLTATVLRELQAADNELWLSPISVWEAQMLQERGRITVASGTTDWIADFLRVKPMREARVTHEVAIASRRVEVSHQDPADRFIAATAQVYGLTLVTADDRLIAAPSLAVLPNR
jgi:PIN domain nuclease of toxin-antitoxin system